jgi:hypothetical protein
MSVPGPPLIYPQGSGSFNSIQLWWRAPLTDGGSPITSYTISCPELGYSQQLTNTSFNTIISVPNYVNYYFNIVASNSIGTGVPAYFRKISAGYQPNAISSISVTIVSSFFARIDWTLSSVTNQQVIHSYLLYAIPSTVGISTLRYPVRSWVSSFNFYGYTSSYAFRVVPVGTGASWAKSVPSTAIISMS